jgi:catechol 2,3-dioxygenase-like lactoylglutathione lyase family enzyme
MIEIDGITAWSPTERARYAPLASREINVAARSLRRAVHFYSRVFGLRPTGDHGDSGPAVLRVALADELVIHEVAESVLLGGSFVRSWGFVVADLDRARQIVWELGVQIARDSGTPDSIYRWSNGRSLYVWAPDGNQIELVEIGYGPCLDVRALGRWAPTARKDRAAHPRGTVVARRMRSQPFE